MRDDTLRRGSGEAVSDVEGVIDFETWSDLAARMLKRDERGRAAVLAAKGIEPALWVRSDAHHNRTIVEDVANDRVDRRHAYGRKCAEELARRKAEAAAAPREGHDPPPVSASPVSASPVSASPVSASPVSASPVSASPVSASPVHNSPAPLPAELEATAVFQSPLLAQSKDLLPFGGKPTLDSTPRQPSGLPHPGSGSTLPLGIELMAHVRKALPFAGLPSSAAPAAPVPLTAPAPAPSSARFTVQRYASLCAELALYPAKRAATLARYGISDEAAYRALEHDWQLRLADPEARSQWQDNYTTYSDWLRQQQGR